MAVALTDKSIAVASRFSNKRACKHRHYCCETLNRKKKCSKLQAARIAARTVSSAVQPFLSCTKPTCDPDTLSTVWSTSLVWSRTARCITDSPVCGWHRFAADFEGPRSERNRQRRCRQNREQQGHTTRYREVAEHGGQSFGISVKEVRHALKVWPVAPRVLVPTAAPQHASFVP